MKYALTLIALLGLIAWGQTPNLGGGVIAGDQHIDVATAGLCADLYAHHMRDGIRATTFIKPVRLPVSPPVKSDIDLWGLELVGPYECIEETE